MTVVADGKVAIADFLKSVVSHVAVGMSDDAVTEADTQLGTEVYRQAPSSTVRVGNRVQVRILLPHSLLPSRIEEVGWFAKLETQPPTRESLW